MAPKPRWHVVAHVSWGPGGAFTEKLYLGELSLDELPKALERAVEEAENMIPDGATVTGIEKVELYSSIGDMCREHSDIEAC